MDQLSKIIARTDNLTPEEIRRILKAEMEGNVIIYPIAGRHYYRLLCQMRDDKWLDLVECRTVDGAVPHRDSPIVFWARRVYRAIILISHPTDMDEQLHFDCWKNVHNVAAHGLRIDDLVKRDGQKLWFPPEPGISEKEVSGSASIKPQGQATASETRQYNRLVNAWDERNFQDKCEAMARFIEQKMTEFDDGGDASTSSKTAPGKD